MLDEINKKNYEIYSFMTFNHKDNNVYQISSFLFNNSRFSDKKFHFHAFSSFLDKKR